MPDYNTHGNYGPMPRQEFNGLSRRPITVAEYMTKPANRRRRAFPWEIAEEPSGLQTSSPGQMGYSTPPPPPAEEYYRGMYEGVPVYTNIPEVAAQKGLQRFDLAPPSAQVGGVEMYGTTEGYPGAPVTSKLQAAQMTGAFKSSTPTSPTSQANLMPRTAEEAQTEIQRMITVGRQKGYADNDILADIKERGLDKILAAKETRIPYKIGGVEYGLTPKEYADMPGVKEEKSPSKIEEFEILNPEMKGKRGTPEYREAFGKMKPEEFKQGTKEYLYGQTVSQYDNDDTVKQFKRTQSVIPYIEQAKKSYKETGNAGLLQDALIYAHNKTLDADSVVMVSEYLRAKGQGSLLDRFQGSVTKAIEGSAGLGPEQQKIMVDAVDSALKKKEQLYDQRVKAYRARAKRYEIPDEELKDMFPLSKELFGEEVEQPPAVTTGGGAMADLPSPTEHTGRIVKDTDTGKRYKSNGTSWQEVQ